MQTRASDQNSYYGCEDQLGLVDKGTGYDQEVGLSLGHSLNDMGTSSAKRPNSGGIC